MTKNYTKLKNRIILVTLGFLFTWVLFAVKLFSIQVINQSENIQGIRTEVLNGKRGNFLDSQGNYLTQNLFYYDIDIFPKKINDFNNILFDLSECTGTDIKIYFSKIDNSRNSITLEKKSEKNCEFLQAKYPSSLSIKRNYKRFYPDENLFGQIIGFTDIDDNGISGLEYELNSKISPEKIQNAYKNNGLGKRILDPSFPIREPDSGLDIKLSLNREYQAILREELLNQIEKVEAESGMGIIINPQNGKILAMLSVPDFDPNNPSNYDLSYHRNRIVQDMIEPGSTLKIVTISSALKNDKKSSDEYNVEGPYNFHNIKMIEDSEPYSILNIKEILGYSSNIGTIKIAEELGKDKIYNQLTDFGFGSKSGIENVNEASGFVRKTKDWTLSSMYSIPMGYEISATPLQLAMAYSSIANGGYLLKPILVDEILKNDEIIFKSKKDIKRRILSNYESKELIEMLSFTVQEGSGKKAKISGWNVAGKTGTSKKLIDGKYSESEFISSFIGFLPAENPQLLALIIIEGAESKKNYHWGSIAAAPVFESVIKRVINIDPLSIEIENDELRKKELNKPIMIQKNIKKEPQELVSMPNLIGKNIMEAFDILRKNEIKGQISGSGLVVYQSISAGEKIEKNSICIIKASTE